MTRTAWSAGVATVAMAALAGCQAKPPTTPPPTEEPKPIASAPGAPAFAAITAVCPTLPAGLPVVKIQIIDVSPKKLGHATALFEANQDGTRSTEKKLRDIPEVVLKTETPTRLDLDATEFLKKDGDVLLVEVELADPAASFVAGPAAITAGNDEGGAMFCIKDKDHPVAPKPGDRTARFYVKYLSADGPKLGKFNVFLLLKDGPYLTPTVLDPKIRNSG